MGRRYSSFRASPYPFFSAPLYARVAYGETIDRLISQLRNHRMVDRERTRGSFDRGTRKLNISSIRAGESLASFPVVLRRSFSILLFTTAFSDGIPNYLGLNSTKYIRYDDRASYLCAVPRKNCFDA